MKTNIKPIPYGKDDSAASVIFVDKGGLLGRSELEINAEMINSSGDCIDRKQTEMINVQEYRNATDREAYILGKFGFVKAEQNNEI